MELPLSPKRWEISRSTRGIILDDSVAMRGASGDHYLTPVLYSAGLTEVERIENKVMNFP